MEARRRVGSDRRARQTAAMRRALLCLLVASPALAGPPALLTLGVHHGDEVKKPGQGWLGLYAKRLAPVTVTLTRVHDPIVDEEKPDAVKTGVEVAVAGAEQPLLLVKGLPAREVAPLPLVGLPALGGDAPVQLGDATLTSTPHGKTGRQLVLARGGVAQVLYQFDDGDTDGWALRWAGDLDGDGKLDLLLTADHHYSVSTLRLFLSSRAKKGQLVREVATFRTTGC